VTKPGTSSKSRRKAGARSAKFVDESVVRKIQAVESIRLPYGRLLTTIVDETLHEWLPAIESRAKPSHDADFPVLEVGAGIGHLRTLLPADVARITHHTEPLEMCVAEFRTRFPQAKLSGASANELPAKDASAHAILGLAVFDVIEDLDAAVAEFARVLAPGGRVIHFLDQNPYLAPLFERLRGIEMIPFPNVFSDPCDKDFPDDLFLIPRADLELVASILMRRQHAFQTPLRRYLSIFGTSPLQTERALGEFENLAGSAEHRDMLRVMLKTAFELATLEERAQLAAFQGQTVSSSSHLAGRLEKAFTAGGAFEIELSDIVTAHSYSPDPTSGNPVYQSLCDHERRCIRTPAIPGQ
jgi:SAM-dependent methyltransferase